MGDIVASARRLLPRSVAVVAAAVMALPGLVACGGSNARMVVTHRTDLVSHPLRLMLTGLDAGERVTIAARTRDRKGHPWSSAATFVAGSDGRVDVATSKPVSGSYSATSAYGLLGTMKPVAGGEAGFAPPARDRITLTATAKGRTLTHTSVVRLSTGRGVTVHRTTVRHDGFDGYLYLPPRSSTRKPAVLAFGGSEGGSYAGGELARALAAEGYPALGIGYFGVAGLPRTLSRVPIEYFGRALRYLAKQSGVDPKRIAVLGVSRGSEAAQLVGVHYPRLVHAVLPMVPANVAICSPDHCNGPAWTWHGRAVPYTSMFDQPDPTDHPDAVIPDEHVDGPMLMACGGADKIWFSCPYARAIMRRRRTHHSHYHDTLLEYAKAGHGIGLPVPGLNGTYSETAGATPDANALAVGRLWPRLLTFLAHIPS